MATILDFPEMQAAPSRQPMRRSKPSAEIILFPGVRYERWDEAIRDQEARQQTVVRDRLKLVD